MRVVMARLPLGLLTACALLAGAVAGCSTDRDVQWYKPNVDYTVADFNRDRTACEKNGKIDKACLRERGWMPLTADKEPAPPPPAQTPRGGAAAGAATTGTGPRY